MEEGSRRATAATAGNRRAKKKESEARTKPRGVQNRTHHPESTGDLTKAVFRWVSRRFGAPGLVILAIGSLIGAAAWHWEQVRNLPGAASIERSVRRMLIPRASDGQLLVLVADLTDDAGSQYKSIVHAALDDVLRIDGVVVRSLGFSIPGDEPRQREEALDILRAARATIIIWGTVLGPTASSRAIRLQWVSAVNQNRSEKLWQGAPSASQAWDIAPEFQATMLEALARTLVGALLEISETSERTRARLEETVQRIESYLSDRNTPWPESAKVALLLAAGRGYSDIANTYRDEASANRAIELLHDALEILERSDPWSDDNASSASWEAYSLLAWAHMQRARTSEDESSYDLAVRYAQRASRIAEENTLPEEVRVRSLVTLMAAQIGLASQLGSVALLEKANDTHNRAVSLVEGGRNAPEWRSALKLFEGIQWITRGWLFNGPSSYAAAAAALEESKRWAGAKDDSYFGAQSLLCLAYTELLKNPFDRSHTALQELTRSADQCVRELLEVGNTLSERDRFEARTTEVLVRSIAGVRWRDVTALDQAERTALALLSELSSIELPTDWLNAWHSLLETGIYLARSGRLELLTRALEREPVYRRLLERGKVPLAYRRSDLIADAFITLMELTGRQDHSEAALRYANDDVKQAIDDRGTMYRFETKLRMARAHLMTQSLPGVRNALDILNSLPEEYFGHYEDDFSPDDAFLQDGEASFLATTARASSRLCELTGEPSSCIRAARFTPMAHCALKAVGRDQEAEALSSLWESVKRRLPREPVQEPTARKSMNEPAAGS